MGLRNAVAAIDITYKPLVDGERLSREEFIGRWDLLPEVKFAELIGGVVHMPSPLSASHGSGDALAGYWLSHYAAATPGCDVLHNATWLMLGDVPQPDVALRILPECGGQSGQRGALAAGAPELIVEVCVTSEKLDTGEKKDLYQTAGVIEYIVFFPGSRILWYTLAEGRYRESPPGPDGLHRSSAFPGLWLDPAALLAGDGRRIVDVVNRGLATPEHAAFVAQLDKQKR
jgi:Uma2 family endonuclease